MNEQIYMNEEEEEIVEKRYENASALYCVYVK